ncbi:hypothetical protein [Runella slithyformis]|uniref:Uncharacterized protein n=1 Tax=Runella slithyformis (strain ATCC 29530 / DSM 19594 / LMG 11500 / NCIMB 11436 / LSU 4) TaxID=761193 RepID=A0A7U3ZIE0_RUNSL|nr:hypothetical protein [Runella slithyformis]AEI47781.1 hypothetical protein Runsl_1354 [Runella slithyformis DSM 19594]
MEIALLLTITGLVGLATSVGMLYLSHTSGTEGTDSTLSFNRRRRDDFFRRVKLNAHRLK